MLCWLRFTLFLLCASVVPHRYVQQPWLLLHHAVCESANITTWQFEKLWSRQLWKCQTSAFWLLQTLGISQQCDTVGSDFDEILTCTNHCTLCIISWGDITLLFYFAQSHIWVTGFRKRDIGQWKSTTECPINKVCHSYTAGESQMVDVIVNASA